MGKNTPKKAATKSRSRLDILTYVVQFCIPVRFNDGSFSKPSDNRTGGYMVCNIMHDKVPPIGALVRLESIGTTRHYLGWLLEIGKLPNGDTKYLIDSIEDGAEPTWYYNVGIAWFPKEFTDEKPHWRWNDDQWNLWKRWQHACYKRRCADWTRPMMPVFTDDGGVILKTRTKFNMNDYSPERKFPNWRRVLTREMLEFYDFAEKGPANAGNGKEAIPV